MADIAKPVVKIEMSDDMNDVKTEGGPNMNNNNNNNRHNNDEYDERSGDSSGNCNQHNDSDVSTRTNLIVNYLPQQMTDEEFENLFKEFGSMKSCKIVRNRVSGNSYGFGFVDYETHEQALKAIDKLNGHELETKKIKVAFARPAGQDIKQANLYIKNVPNDWTQDDVRKIFEPYGNIIQVRVLGNNRGVAFVLYDLRRQAQDALEALNGKPVPGCETPLEIKFAADKKVEKTGNKSSGGGNSSGNSGRSRGSRGSRNHGRNRDNQGSRQHSQSSRPMTLFKGGNDDRQQRGAQNQYSAVQYGGGAQYNPNFNSNMNDVGPMRQAGSRVKRYAPFIPVLPPLGPTMAQMTPTVPMVAQLAPAAAVAPQAPTQAYGFIQTQQQQPTMIPYTMLPTQQSMPQMQTQQMAQPVQMPMAQPQPQQTSLSMYTSPQMPMTYAPMAAQTAMNNMYNIASNNMTNAANLQPTQLGQQMGSMRTTSNHTASNNHNHHSRGGGGSYDNDGATLFVYNIGPDASEDDLRSMFSPYGHVVKCNVVRKTPGGETKGFGFVTLKDGDQANEAISGLNGSMKNGRTLQVSLKK